MPVLSMYCVAQVVEITLFKKKKNVVSILWFSNTELEVLEQKFHFLSRSIPTVRSLFITCALTEPVVPLLHAEPELCQLTPTEANAAAPHTEAHTNASMGFSSLLAHGSHVAESTG